MQQHIIPLTDEGLLAQHGIHNTTDSLRWQYRRRQEYGLEEAFIRLGTRIYLDPDRYHELVRKPDQAAAVG